MRKAVLLGFLLLLAIDTTQQVIVKLVTDRVGPLDPEQIQAWLDKLLAEPLVLGIAGCYLAAFFTYTALLKHAPVGPAYAAVHGHVVTVLIISIVFFGEQLTLLQGAGCAAIFAGIVILGVTEKMG